MGNRLTARDREAYTAYAFGLISGAFDIIGAEDEGFDVNKPVFTVGQTAELVGIRRYSLRDINKLVLTQHLVIEESINLSGVSRILRLMEENRQLRRQIRYLKKAKDLRMFAAGANGNVTEVFGDDSPAGQMKRELARRRRALRMARARGRLLPPGQYSRIQLRITAHTEGPDEG